jgi:glutamyl-Q tRNA(Asp) synthetase
MSIESKPYKTRFAPSPTGLLHLGHGMAALEVYKAANKNNSAMVLRIEDIDQTRCKPDYTAAIFEDLSWLGITWDQSKPIRHQSNHFNDYKAALSKLDGLGLLYPCVCTRTDIKSAPNSKMGPEGIIYPGTCRHKNLTKDNIEPGTLFAFRLDMSKAIDYLKTKNMWPIYWVDEMAGEQLATPEIFGDVVLARKDTPTSYHLAVTLDDHLQNITHVVRGMDLFASTHVHRLLQALLGLNTPRYLHHPLIMADDGEKLSKRKGGKSLRALREEGKTVEDIMALIKTAEGVKN